MRLMISFFDPCSVCPVKPDLRCCNPTSEPPEWVQRSNEHSQILLRVLARFSPEEAGAAGRAGV